MKNPTHNLPTICPMCRSKNISQTCLGWFFGRNSNKTRCIDCGFEGEAWKFENAAISILHQLRIKAFLLIQKRKEKSFKNFLMRGCCDTAGIQMVIDEKEGD